MALTDTEIRRTKKREKPYKLSDGGNLYLWITPSGGKLWRWAYRHEGKEKLMTFGRYPEVSLARARSATWKPESCWLSGLIPWQNERPRKSRIKLPVKIPSPVLRSGGWSIGSRERVLAM